MNLVSSEDYLSGRNQMEPDALINKANLDEDAEHRMPETAETKIEDELGEQSQIASIRHDEESVINPVSSDDCLSGRNPMNPDAVINKANL